jgi:hypothetical protein
MVTATQKTVWGTVGQTAITQAGGRLAVAPNGELFAVSHHGEIRVFDTEMKQVRRWKVISEPDHLELFWGPDSDTLYCVHNLRNNVLTVSVQSGTTTEEWSQNNVTCVASNESGTFVAFGLKCGKVAVYRKSDQKHMQTVEICIRDKSVTKIYFLSENAFIAENENGDIGHFDVK